MDITFFAKVFGPCIVFFGLFQVFYREHALKVAKNFQGSHGAYWLEAIVSMIFGLAIINGANDWSTGWYAMIPIYGWLSFLKGVLLLFLPNPTYSSLWGNKINNIILGALRLVFGYVFICVGYF
ncbi:MAG: hypothetical protein K9M07_01020 [Simkaniaceae bacterium]|nr:hypothetical protein [Simkaniaceae bacterium]